MILQYNLWGVVGSLLVGTIAVVFDLKYRRIPNWLTFSGMAVALSLNLIFNSNHWTFGLLGIVTGFLLLFIPFSLGGIGAGDVKLLMALGAFLGPMMILWVGLIGGIAGGVISLGTIIKKRGLWGILTQFQLLISKFQKSNNNDLNTSETNGVPEPRLNIAYGLAIYIGLILVLVWKLLSR